MADKPQGPPARALPLSAELRAEAARLRQIAARDRDTRRAQPWVHQAERLEAWAARAGRLEQFARQRLRDDRLGQYRAGAFAAVAPLIRDKPTRHEMLEEVGHLVNALAHAALAAETPAPPLAPAAPAPTAPVVPPDAVSTPPSGASGPSGDALR